MNYYERTRKKLESAGLMVQAHPLIWLKSDGKGIIPGRSGEYPRRVYETAFLCSRGNRPLGKQLENAYASPSESNPLQPTQKSESMLKHFLAMLIDGTTDVLDPTCGSGSALRAAEHLGARSILGLELNPEFAKAAATATAQARIKRKASGGIQ
jgi:DNA modification methylase